jgi:hypothetical protein
MKYIDSKRDITEYKFTAMDSTIRNPYLNEIIDIIKKLRQNTKEPTALHLMDYRYELITKFAFSIPTISDLELIREYSPIIEIGAGSGYWAYCLSQLGVDIITYDKYPPEITNPWLWDERNTWFDNEWFTVTEGDESAAAVFPDRSLLMAWPMLNNSMAKNALENYVNASGHTLIFIGNHESSGDDVFNSMIKNFKLIKKQRLYGWYGIEEFIEIYKI